MPNWSCSKCVVWSGLVWDLCLKLKVGGGKPWEEGECIFGGSCHELCSVQQLRKWDVRKKTLRAFYISISKMMGAHCVNLNVRKKVSMYAAPDGTRSNNSTTSYICTERNFTRVPVWNRVVHSFVVCPNPNGRWCTFLTTCLQIRAANANERRCCYV